MELSALLPLLREKCSGMLEQQAIDHLKKAYRIFCIESGYVQRTETVERLIDGSVVLTPDDGYYIQQINAVEDETGEALRSGIDYKVTADSQVSLIDGFTMTIITYSIVPTLPMPNTLIIDNALLQRWPDEIAAGAAAFLRIIPNQTWTDVNLSDFYRRDFVKGHREAYRARVVANDERQFQPVSTREFF